MNLIDELIQAGEKIVVGGLVRGSGGNLSCRAAPEMISITRAGADLGRLTPADFVSVPLAMDETAAGGAADGASIRPSSELAMHRAAYQAQPAAQVVLHVHPPQAISLGLVERELPAFTPDFYLHLGPRVPLIPYITPTTAGLATAVYAALRQGPAALLQNHGVIVMADSVTRALLRLFLLEEHAGIYLAALAVGAPRSLTLPDQEDLDRITGGRYRRE